MKAKDLTEEHMRARNPELQTVGIAIAKAYIYPLAIQWTLTILESIATLAPQFVLFRLLQRLGAQDQPIGSSALYLAILLGLSKIFELWIGSWLEWITASQIQIPIKATLSSLVYHKRLRLPNVASSSTIAGDTAQSPLKSINNHISADR